MASGHGMHVRRYIPALDAVRGIAAMVVLVGHCTLAYEIPREARLGLDLILNQRAAVLTFFVLSGYVLCQSWRAGREALADVAKFYIRRAFRLVPALWMVTLMALLWLAAFPPPLQLATATDWALSQYAHIPIERQIRGFFAVDNALVPPTWTITIEIVGSIALPLIATMLGWGRGVAALLLAACLGLTLVTGEMPGRWSGLAFALQFVVGAALAIYGPELNRRGALRAGVTGVALLFAARPLWKLVVTGALQDIEYRVNAAVPAVGETIGAALLVAALVSPHVKADSLSRGPLLYLGSWSYSIYLAHFVVLRAGMYVTPASFSPIAAMLCLTFMVTTVTIALSAAIYRYVELPGIACGKAFLQSPRFQKIVTMRDAAPS